MGVVHIGVQHIAIPHQGFHFIHKIAPAILPPQRERKQRHGPHPLLSVRRCEGGGTFFLQTQAVVVPHIGGSVPVIEQPACQQLLHVVAAGIGGGDGDTLGGAVPGPGLPLEVVDDLPPPAGQFHGQVGAQTDLPPGFPGEGHLILESFHLNGAFHGGQILRRQVIGHLLRHPQLHQVGADLLQPRLLSLRPGRPVHGIAAKENGSRGDTHQQGHEPKNPNTSVGYPHQGGLHLITRLVQKIGKLAQAAQNQNIDHQNRYYKNQSLDIQQSKSSQNQVEPNERSGGSRLDRLSRPAAHLFDGLPQADILNQREQQHKIGQPAMGIFCPPGGGGVEDKNRKPEHDRYQADAPAGSKPPVFPPQGPKAQPQHHGPHHQHRRIEIPHIQGAGGQTNAPHNAVHRPPPGSDLPLYLGGRRQLPRLLGQQTVQLVLLTHGTHLPGPFAAFSAGDTVCPPPPAH